MLLSLDALVKCSLLWLNPDRILSSKVKLNYLTIQYLISVQHVSFLLILSSKNLIHFLLVIGELPYSNLGQNLSFPKLLIMAH